MALYNIVHQCGLQAQVEERQRFYAKRIAQLGRQIVVELGIWVEVEELASREQLSNPAYWVGAIYLLSFMGQLATISAAKLGLITLPPINTFTEIADAAMEMGVADGSVNPYTATAYSWGIWLDLLQSYNAGASVAAWCADAPAHSAWCEAAKVL